MLEPVSPLRPVLDQDLVKGLPFGRRLAHHVVHQLGL